MGGKRGPTRYEVPPESQKEPGSMTSETLRVGEVGEAKTKLRNDLNQCMTCEDPLHTGPWQCSLDETGMQQSCCIGGFDESVR